MARILTTRARDNLRVLNGVLSKILPIKSSIRPCTKLHISRVYVMHIDVKIIIYMCTSEIRNE